MAAFKTLAIASADKQCSYDRLLLGHSCHFQHIVDMAALHKIPDASSLGFSLNTRFVRDCVYRLMSVWLELPLSVFQHFFATFQDH